LPKKATEVVAQGTRKRGPLRSTKEIRNKLKNYDDQFDELIQALFDAAKGLKLTDDEGENVYVSRPDTKAAQVLMEYRYGKPPKDDLNEGFSTSSGKNVYNFINVSQKSPELPPAVEETDYEEVDE
jgi:hypothetical protein